MLPTPRGSSFSDEISHPKVAAGMITLEVRYDPADHRLIRAAGHAKIYLNGSLKYKGRPKTGYSCEGDIVDSDGHLVTRCHSIPANWWRAMLDHRTYVIQDDKRAELARIRRHGFFGHDCDILIEGQTFSWQRRGDLILPGVTLSVSSQPLEVRGTISDDNHLLASLGIAFFFWIKRAIDDAYNG